jgi:hypothetical protein
MTGRKPTALSLKELWDLEDEYTAVVGSPTGAKGAQQVVPALAGRGGVFPKASLKGPAIHQQKVSSAKKTKVKV